MARKPKRDMLDARDIIPISEAAKIIGINERQVRIYVSRGDLGRKVERVGLLVTRGEAEAFSEIERRPGWKLGVPRS